MAGFFIFVLLIGFINLLGYSIMVIKKLTTEGGK